MPSCAQLALEALRGRAEGVVLSARRPELGPEKRGDE
jgi:hypothetical protein